MPLADLVKPDTPMDATADVQWREVSATGRYDESQQVLVRNRTYNGIPGYFVLTPLQVPGGDVVIVNRGFVPLETSGTKPKVPAAPSGVVAVNGRVRSTQKRGLFGPRDPVEGTLTEVARADLARLQQQMPYHLLPVYIELETSDPSEARGITPVPLPELDDGPHLSYAIQWFLFSALAVVGWVLVVRKTAKGGDNIIDDEMTDDTATTATIAPRLWSARTTLPRRLASWLSPTTHPSTTSAHQPPTTSRTSRGTSNRSWRARAPRESTS